MSLQYSHSSLPTLIEACRSAGYRFAAPVREGDRTHFGVVTSADALDLDSVVTDVSAKEFVFARCEAVCDFARDAKGEISVGDPCESSKPQPTVIFGARPCDAAALPILRKVFEWDYPDPFVLRKLDSTLVVTIPCTQTRETCFCTSVGLAPDSPQGSDIILHPAQDKGLFVVEPLTGKGRNLVARFPSVFTQGSAKISDAPHTAGTAMKPRFSPEELAKHLKNSFAEPFWKSAAEACIGCGACAFTCPTCHCFDIVDEGNQQRGARFKNWDACQFPLFTLHTSGHNPRAEAFERYRQRIMHKFLYFREKFGSTLCTGCGRCVANCPVGVSMLDIVERAAKLVPAAQGETK